MTFDYSLDDSDIVRIEKNYLTFAELAEKLGVNQNYLYQNKEALKIKYTTIFHLSVVPKSELLRLQKLREKKQKKVNRNKKLVDNRQPRKGPTVQQLRKEAKELNIKISNLSKSKLALEIAKRRQRQLENPAIGISLDHLITHAYKFSIQELKEALKDFSVTKLKDAMAKNDFTTTQTKTKQELIEQVINIIGAGYV